MQRYPKGRIGLFCTAENEWIQLKNHVIMPQAQLQEKKLRTLSYYYYYYHHHCHHFYVVCLAWKVSITLYIKNCFISVNQTSFISTLKNLHYLIPHSSSHGIVRLFVCRCHWIISFSIIFVTVLWNW